MRQWTQCRHKLCSNLKKISTWISNAAKNENANFSTRTLSESSKAFFLIIFYLFVLFSKEIKRKKNKFNKFWPTEFIIVVVVVKL